MLNLHFYSYDLQLSQAFTIALNSRTITEAIFVELQLDGLIGNGQASFPPYMKERREDNLKFLSSVDLNRFKSPVDIAEVLKYLDEISPVCIPAKAAIDIALHDLMGKVKGLPVYSMLGLENKGAIYTSFTISMGDDEFVQQQLKLAGGYKTLKVKLNGDINYNKRTIELIRSHSNQPIAIDFNQGLERKEDALFFIKWLADKNITFVEQPMPVNMEGEGEWLKKQSPIDIFGDESIQNAEDLISKQNQFHGVNIKLMKCGGISKAYKLALLAKELRLKTMIGCMTESVCAVTAAAHLSSLFDKADLDGNLLINNDLFTGISINNGEVIIPEAPGLGLTKINL